ncbi:MAG TPA: NUDIX domain-containing protein [Gemmatimonadaceae bacterium]|nr:NUDIX domain-containing protein [Gemmatimonadaceae bacterium]
MRGPIQPGADVPIFGRREPERAYRVRDAAYAVIFDERRRVACVTEESGLFLPGGGLEAGEDPVRAVQREVAEECGRTVEILSPLGSAVQICHSIRGGDFELHATFFLARFGPVLPAPGHLEVHWFPAAAEPPPLYHECHRWAVQRAIG